MKIEKIDANFKKVEFSPSQPADCYTIPCVGFDLYGVYYDENLKKFTRMDYNVAQKVNDGVRALSTNTSGGRLRFSTDSAFIGISVAYPWLAQMSHMPLTGSSGFALLEKVGETYKTVSLFRPASEEAKGYTGKVDFGERKKREFLLFFPLYNDVSELKIYLEPSAEIYEPEKYRDIPPILYYGASIDQGGCASRPDSSYTAILSKWNNIDFINLGFSGSCLGEPLMAEYLTGIDCSLFFMAYDGNAPSIEYLEKTHYPFYEAYRRAKKDVPIVFMSVPCFENYPNARQSRDLIKESYEKARRSGDRNVYFLDGEALFGEKDREICTVEGIHPNDLGFYRIAEAIKDLFDKIGL
ncbi:MAG: hypothetical protein IIW23_04465 [Clostridia bacterium]|nr:hypothetical protein [Clostridia bacterium]